MSNPSQLLSSLFKCNDPEPECAASFQVNLPEQIDIEVTLYHKSPLSNEVKKDSSFDVLHWWYQHKTSYPNLCQLVNYCLCVLSSINAGNIVTKT